MSTAQKTLSGCFFPRILLPGERFVYYLFIFAIAVL